MVATRATKFTLNGRAVEIDAPRAARLLDVLRGPLGMVGTKEGCGEGECGACTVLIEGEPVNACLVALGQVEDARVVTVEGVARGEALTALQRCFIEDGAAQCGICTPGMLLSADALLQRNPSPSADDVREAIAGNLCRCTGYQRIVDAILRAARESGGAPAEGKR